MQFTIPGRARVTAIVNPHLGDVGLLGHFESEDDPGAAREVLDQAREWLQAQGMRVVRGPMNGATWFDYRFVVAGDAASFTGEPRHPAYYPRLWEAAGFAPCSHYGSFWIDDVDAVLDRWAPKVARDVVVRPAAAGDLPAIHAIAHEAFAGAYMFSPIGLAELAALYGGAAGGGGAFVVDDLGFTYTFVADLGGEPVTILKTIAISPAARDRGVYHALFSAALRAGRERGARRAIAALIHLDGSPALMGWQRGRVFKRYALYEHS